MRVEISEITPYEFLMGEPRVPTNGLRQVTFSVPFQVQLIGEPVQAFWVDPAGRLHHLGPASPELAAYDLPLYLARNWPGVTFLAPGENGQLVALVDCRIVKPGASVQEVLAKLRADAAKMPAATISEQIAAGIPPDLEDVDQFRKLQDNHDEPHDVSEWTVDSDEPQQATVEVESDELPI